MAQATNWILNNPGGLQKNPDPPPKPKQEDPVDDKEKEPEEPVNIDEDLVEQEFLVHKAVWMLDIDSIKHFAKIPRLLNTVDLRGQTPLSLAYLLERDEVAQRLLELGSDPRTVIGDG